MVMTLKNLWARKITSCKIIISFTIMITIMCVFMTYVIALENKAEEIIYSYRSGHCYIIDSDELPMGATKENLEKINNVNWIKSYGTLSPVHGIFDIELKVGDESYKCYHSEYQQGNTPPNADASKIAIHQGKIDFIEGKKLITPNDELEANYRWAKPKLLANGKERLRDNEMLVSQQLLDEYRLSTDIVGKTISLVYNGAVFEDIEIVGVIDSKFYKLTGNRYDSHMVMSVDSALYNAINKYPAMSYHTEMHVTDYLISRKVANELTSIAGIADYRIGSEYGLAMASTVTLVNVVVVGVMVTVGLGILTALLLNVIHSMGFLMVKKSNYYGILRAYGVHRYKLFNMMFLEIFILAMLSAVLAYVVSYAIVLLADLAIASLIGIGVTFTPLNVGITFITAIGSSAILAVIVAVINYTIIMRKDINELLRYSMEG